MEIEVISNIAKVTNVAAVEAILAKYHTSVEFLVNGIEDSKAGTLRVAEGSGSLNALFTNETPDPDNHACDLDWFDAIFEKYNEDGVEFDLATERFILLLSELKPYLSSPLKIVDLDFNESGERINTKWTVRRQAKGIEMSVTGPGGTSNSLIECDTATGKLISCVESQVDDDDELEEAVLQITGDKGDLQRIAQAIELLSDVTVQNSTDPVLAVDTVS